MAPSRGFTLTELLVVTAIIGVLATIGVPKYTEMIRRARQREGILHLGVVYAAEMAFRAEFGFFGNNLQAMGFDTSGDGLKYYSVGFSDSGAGSGCMDPAKDPLRIFPNSTSPALYNALSIRMPTYYDLSKAGGLAPVQALALGTGSGLGPGMFLVCLKGSWSENAFLASATGVIGSVKEPYTDIAGLPAHLKEMDAWSIDENRVLKHHPDVIF